MKGPVLFEKTLLRISQSYDLNRVFEDFLQVSICLLANQTMEETYLATIKRYDRKALDLFAQAFAELWIDYCNNSDGSGSWNDLLGEVYMNNLSRSKAGATGQFFTPVYVCQMMAEMVGSKDPCGEICISDPAAGSSRNLIAHSRLHPQNRFNAFYYAMDLDYICVMMSVLNMIMFGLKGIVIHMNSLSNEIYSGYRVYLPETGLMVRKLNRDQCWHYLSKKEEVQNTLPCRFGPIKEEDWNVIYTPISGHQTSLFD